MSRINITTEGRPLMRVTVDGDRLTLESNLDDGVSATAIADAITELGRSFAGASEARARDQAAMLRARNATAHEGAGVLIELVTEVFGSEPPEINVDLPGWYGVGAN